MVREIVGMVKSSLSPWPGLPIGGHTLADNATRQISPEWTSLMNETRVLLADASPRSFEAVPSVCEEALAALRSPYATTEEIGGIIAQDRTMKFRLLQAVNSAQFGLPRKITDAAEAVGLLGFETVASILAELEAMEPVQPVQTGIFPHQTPLVSHHGGGAERQAARTAA